MYDTKNLAYVLTSLESIEKIFIYTKSIDSAEDFLQINDQLVYNACLTLIMVIGEEVNKIDDNLKNEFPDIPWHLIKGMRNRIAHDYRGVDPTIPFNIIKKHLQPLKNCLIKMLGRIDYSKPKLTIILSSDYYKNIRYLANIDSQ